MDVGDNKSRDRDADLFFDSRGKVRGLADVDDSIHRQDYVEWEVTTSSADYPDFDKIYDEFKADNVPTEIGGLAAPVFEAMMLDPTDEDFENEERPQRQILDGGGVSYLFPGSNDQMVLEENPTGTLADWSLLGMPRNLDGDKDPTTDPPQADETVPGDSTADPNWKYEMLPVMVRVSWNSRVLGTMTTDLRTVIAKK